MFILYLILLYKLHVNTVNKHVLNGKSDIFLSNCFFGISHFGPLMLSFPKLLLYVWYNSLSNDPATCQVLNNNIY